MQLDKTRLVIRERGNSELLDLTFHVLRTHVGPILLLLVIGALPFALINAWLVGWLGTTSSETFGFDDIRDLRYYWAMYVLVFLQSPLATSLVTIYLGQAVFVERPLIRAVFADLWRLGLRQLWCQGILRLALPVTFLVAFMDPSNADFQPAIEFYLLMVATSAMVIRRSVRPYVSEIVLLEKNPLMSQNRAAMTVARRAKMLHENNGGDLFSRWLGAALASIALFVSVYWFLLFLQGIFVNNWHHNTWFMVHIGFPLALWMVAGYIAIYRFLSYLNLRIHNEGWEVDLLLRAEAARLQESPLAG
jgi:hypothetical protein